MYEPKPGDVVALRSSPHVHMTVVAFDMKDGFYELFWINDQGAANAIRLKAIALTKVEQDDAPPPELAETQAELARAAGAASALQIENATLRSEIAELKGAHVRAVLHARAALDVVQADAQPDAIVQELVRRLDTFKREANQQIAELQARVPA
jgi:hypothetical protein